MKDRLAEKCEKFPANAKAQVLFLTLASQVG